LPACRCYALALPAICLLFCCYVTPKLTFMTRHGIKNHRSGKDDPPLSVLFEIVKWALDMRVDNGRQRF
jgi:hypothetical protein